MNIAAVPALIPEIAPSPDTPDAPAPGFDALLEHAKVQKNRHRKDPVGDRPAHDDADHDAPVDQAGEAPTEVAREDEPRLGPEEGDTTPLLTAVPVPPVLLPLTTLTPADATMVAAPVDDGEVAETAPAATAGETAPEPGLEAPSEPRALDAPDSTDVDLPESAPAEQDPSPAPDAGPDSVDATAPNPDRAGPTALPAALDARPPAPAAAPAAPPGAGTFSVAASSTLAPAVVVETVAAAAPAPPPPPVEQLVTVLRPLRTEANGAYRLHLELRPPELGRIELRVEMRDGVLHATLHADNESAEQTLRDALPLLRDRLAAEGVRAGRLTIDDGRAGSQFGQRQAQPHDEEPASRPRVMTGPEPADDLVDLREDDSLDVRL